MSGVPIFFQGEARLIRWSESANAGRTVTLEIEESEGQHPFKGLPFGASHGQRMKVAIVLIDDNEEPVAALNAASGPRQEPESLPVKQARPFKDLPKSQQAAIKCQDAAFQMWLGVAGDVMPEQRPSVADTLLKSHLCIVSKKDLDRWPEAGAKWDQMLASFDLRNYGVR